MPNGPGCIDVGKDGTFKTGASSWSCVIPKKFVKNSKETDENGKQDIIVILDSTNFCHKWKRLEGKINCK